MKKTGIEDYTDDTVKVEHKKATKKLENKYKKIINKAVNEELGKEGLKVFDYNNNKYINFVISHLRKNVFDVLDEVLGSEMANTVLGHSVSKDMGLKYYKVRRQGRKTALSMAMDEFYRLYLNDIGVANPQNWLKSLGFKKASTKIKNTIPETDLGRMQNQAEAVQSEAKTNAIQLSKEAERAAAGIEKAATRAEKGVERLQTAKDQMDALISEDAPTLDTMSNEQKAKYLDDNKTFGETDIDTEFRLRKEQGLPISEEFRQSTKAQRMNDSDFKSKIRNKMSGVVRPKGFVPPPLKGAAAWQDTIKSPSPDVDMGRQFEDLSGVAEELGVAPEEMLDKATNLSHAEEAKLSDALESPEFKKHGVQGLTPAEKRLLDKLELLDSGLDADDDLLGPLPDSLKEGPLIDSPKKESAWKRIAKKFAKKLPYVGGGISAAFMLKEVFEEQDWRKRNAGKLSVADLRNSELREEYFKLASLEEAASPFPITTGDKREMNMDRAIRKELETLPEFKQIQKSLSSTMEAKVGRSAFIPSTSKGRVESRKKRTKEIDALAARRTEMEDRVRSAMNERNIMDLQGEIDYSKGVEGMQGGFAQRQLQI